MNAGQSLPVAAVWAGLAGAGREEPRSSVELELSRLGIAATVRVGTDVLAAFQDAFENGPGILLISGTGSIAWGRAEDGREGRVGGWGQHIGDEGSGFAIGLEALRRIARHADGRGPETRLQRLVLEHLGLAAVADLIPWASEASRARIAELALVVARAAGAGDAVAGEILVQAVEELEGHVLAILQSLGPWRRPPRIALAGGLLGHGGPLRKPMEGVVVKHQLSTMQRPLDAARGAARLAQAL
jgi:glucosamine kinase